MLVCVECKFLSEYDTTRKQYCTTAEMLLVALNVINLRSNRTALIECFEFLFCRAESSKRIQNFGKMTEMF